MAAVGDAIVTSANVNAAATQDFQPPVDEEWEIHNVFTGVNLSLYRYDGTNAVLLDAVTTARDWNEGQVWHCTRGIYLRTINNAGGAGLVGVAGIITYVSSDGEATGTKRIGQVTLGTGGGANYSLRPPAGEEWLIEELWFEDTHSVYRVGTGNIALLYTDTVGKSYNGFKWHLTNSQYLYLTNLHGSGKLAGYAGVCTKAAP